MLIDLNETQVDELRSLLEMNLRELSYEIASADLPSYRLKLRRSAESSARSLPESTCDSRCGVVDDRIDPAAGNGRPELLRWQLPPRDTLVFCDAVDR